jgi:2-oxoglutarate dehydrogenase E2 component (dihydrolipoamide succinyltransferase)
MTSKIIVPQMGESVVEATVGEWLVQVGDAVQVGDPLVSLETDKVDVEVGAEAAGVVARIDRQPGDDVRVGDVLGAIEANGAAPEPAAKAEPAPKEEQATEKATAVAPPPSQPAPQPADGDKVTPVARRMAAEQGVDVNRLAGSGPGGRVTRQDVATFVQQQGADRVTAVAPSQPDQPEKRPQPTAEGENGRGEERVRLSRRRRTIAARLVEAQQTAAMLTTFNEIDMSAVIAIRERRRESFPKQHGVKLGFTSFFVKAAIGALKAFPRLNAEIDGDEMVLKRYYDIGIAVGAEDGLVVPVIRDADRQSFAAIEQAVKAFGEKSRQGTLSLDDLRGGTFTITNGGIFGSMLSTPILNPPQVGILGLHNIVERPVAVDGEVVIRPVMYVALTYDHRLIDGREAVQFLVRVKELIEDPEALLLAG